MRSMEIDPRLLHAGLLLALLLVFVAVLQIGATDIDLARALADAWARRTSIESLILVDIRLPRALLATLVGATLGLAGAALQGLLRNPLAERGVMYLRAGGTESIGHFADTGGCRDQCDWRCADCVGA